MHVLSLHTYSTALKVDGDSPCKFYDLTVLFCQHPTKIRIREDSFVHSILGQAVGYLKNGLAYGLFSLSLRYCCLNNSQYLVVDMHSIAPTA